MKKLLVLTVFITGLFLSCSYDRHHHYTVENRTTRTVGFYFNGNQSLPPGESMTVSVNSWNEPALPPPTDFAPYPLITDNRRIRLNSGSRTHTIEYADPIPLYVSNPFTDVTIWARRLISIGPPRVYYSYLGSDESNFAPILNLPVPSGVDSARAYIFTKNPRFTVDMPGVAVNWRIDRHDVMRAYIHAR